MKNSIYHNLRSRPQRIQDSRRLRVSDASVIYTLMVVLGLIGITGATRITAQTLTSARSLGMADSYLMLSSNCEAASLNPANLGISGHARGSVKIISASARSSNNAFSLNDYNRYNGAYLSEADKQTILSKIPDNGLILDAAGSVSAMSLSLGNFAFSSSVIGGGKGSFPKDPIELALMGNKVGEMISADGSFGAGWGALSFGLSYGHEIYTYHDWRISVGTTVKYLRGLGYFSAEGIDAQATTLETGFSAQGGMTTLQSLGGSGYGVDLGFAAQNQKYQVGLVVRNLAASLNWDKQVEKHVYSFHLEGANAENAGDDSLWQSDDLKVPAKSFKSRPPLEIECGAARNFGRLLTSASLRKGFVESAFVSKTTRLAGGIEYPLLGLFQLRSGLALGGNEGKSAAVGFGTKLSVLNIDLAYASSGTLLPWGGKGGQLAISTIISF